MPGTGALHGTRRRAARQWDHRPAPWKRASFGVSVAESFSLLTRGTCPGVPTER
ncbi:hypothetical protein SALBM217S_06146 [Streptomyces griseoloalbus]